MGCCKPGLGHHRPATAPLLPATLGWSCQSLRREKSLSFPHTWAPCAPRPRLAATPACKSFAFTIPALATIIRTYYMCWAAAAIKLARFPGWQDPGRQGVRRRRLGTRCPGLLRWQQGSRGCISAPGVAFPLGTGIWTGWSREQLGATGLPGLKAAVGSPLRYSLCLPSIPLDWRTQRSSGSRPLGSRGLLPP